jgi:hypothetical protein
MKYREGEFLLQVRKEQKYISYITKRIHIIKANLKKTLPSVWVKT